MNENGRILTELCMKMRENRVFEKKHTHKFTWVTRVDGRTSY